VGLGFQLGLGGPDLGEPARAAGQFRRQLVSPPAGSVLGVLGGIDPLGLGQEGGDLLLQLPFRLGHPTVAHGLVLGGVGEDLRAIEGHVPELHQPGPLAEPEHLGEQGGQGRQVGLPEGGDGVVVRVLIRREDAVGDLLVRRLLDLARGGLPRAVAIEEELHQQRRVVRGLASPIAGLIRREDRRQVQGLIHHLADEGGRVVLREPVAESRRQQEQLVGVVGLEGFHSRTIPCSRPGVRTE
jgi:hypothetical protein